MDTPSQGGPSTLARQRQDKDKPIEAVALKIAFKADRVVSEAIKSKIPFAEVRGRDCVLKINGRNPGEVADKAREILEVIRSLAEPSKGFN